jgi:hypothetical protein
MRRKSKKWSGNSLNIGSIFWDRRRNMNKNRPKEFNK